MLSLDATHDPQLQSWVASANELDNDFPIQNLPFGVFRRRNSTQPLRGGVAIGDQILDLAAVHTARWFAGSAGEIVAACARPYLNDFMALGANAWTELRGALSMLLRTGASHESQARQALVAQQDAELAVPARIGDFTDFYASIHHATAVGALFRPDNPLLPNYKWVPIAYHGRSSSIGVSGQSFPRPAGQVFPPGSTAPVLRPTQRLDYELEVGIFIGSGNAAGAPISIEEAERHVFGLCLLNDWSARDIQAWEYQPLGPFLAKNFATTLSPWIVTLDALRPYRVPWTRAASDPAVLPYLDGVTLRRSGSVDLWLAAYLETARMRELRLAPQLLSQSNFRESYWSLAQMVAHHTVNGCNLMPGDLLGSGTQSGPEPAQAGSLLELTRGGKQPLSLASGERRTFLEDGDRVLFKGWCTQPGHARIGFGEASGTVLPAN